MPSPPTARDTLLTILAVNQSFDAALGAGPGVDRLVARFVAAIIDQPKEQPRTRAINALRDELVRYYRDAVQPAARKVALANARRVLAAAPGKPDLSDDALRRTVLHEMDARADDRLRIVRANLADKANTLENRLTAYWLEPGETPQRKLERLRQLNREATERAAQYSQQLTAYYTGARRTRPARPQLDFTAKLGQDAKDAMRVQARRAGTDAETATFTAAGYGRLAWVTVNSSQACPGCQGRQGLVGDAAFWDRMGRPGTADTPCGSHCFCMLVPAGTLSGDASLANGLDAPDVREVDDDHLAALDATTAPPSAGPTPAPTPLARPPLPTATVTPEGAAKLRELGLTAEQAVAATVPDGSVFPQVRVHADDAFLDGKAYLHVTADDGAGSQAARVLTHDPDTGRLVIVNESLELGPAVRGGGAGVRYFAAQVEGARSIGAARMETIATRGREFNGYYTWPRMGYDGEVSPLTPARPPEFAGYRRVSDFMATDAGRAWWRANGQSTAVEFDLDPASASSQRLADYLREKSDAR